VSVRTRQEVRKSDSEKELETIGRLIADPYSSICFKRGQRPPLDILKKVFVPGGRMINNDGDAPISLTVEEYVDRFKEEVLDAGMFESFHEMEVVHVTEVFGKIAHRFSTYETGLDLDDLEP